MNELATETAMARYGLKQRFKALSDCVEKDDGDLFLSTRDAYIKYVRNSLILEKILDEGSLSKLIPSEDLPSEERLDLFFMTNDEIVNEIKKEFTTICQVHDILTRGLNETLSFTGSSEKKTQEEEPSSEVVDESNISSDKKEHVHSILIVTPQYNNFRYIWIIFNHKYKNKHKMNIANKFTGNDSDSNASCLLQLQLEKNIDYNHSFLGYMNRGIFNNKTFKDFNKSKLLKMKGKNMLLNDGIKLEKISLELLDEETVRYFS
jgi:hypothetical protein